MRNRLLVIITFVAVVRSVLLAQNATPLMRTEAGRMSLGSDVSIEFGSPQETFASVLNSLKAAGGIVVLTGCGDPGGGPFHSHWGSSAAGAMDLFTAVYPAYYWTIENGVVNVLPKQSALPVMNVRIGVFAWDTSDTLYLSVDRLARLDAVKSRLAELGIRGGLEGGSILQKPPRVRNGIPDPPPKGRPYKIENTTVLAALNAVVASYGKAYWLYEERTCDGKKTYRFAAR